MPLRCSFSFAVISPRLCAGARLEEDYGRRETGGVLYEGDFTEPPTCLHPSPKMTLVHAPLAHLTRRLFAVGIDLIEIDRAANMPFTAWVQAGGAADGPRGMCYL